MVAELEEIGSGGALAALRALAAVGPAAIAADSSAAARRLAANGVREPSWCAQLGFDRPVAARRLRDGVFDDTATVLVEFRRPTTDLYTLGVQIDNSRGGLACSAFVTGALHEVHAVLREDDCSPIRPSELTLTTAGAELRDALALADRTIDAPPSLELTALRAFVNSRVRMLPPGAVAIERLEIGDAEREALLDEFLGAPEGERFEHLPWAHDIVRLAIDFAADYVDGRPLRWSPSVVDRFVNEWLPPRAAADRELAERVGEVLPAWVRYAGCRWGAPAYAVEEAATRVVHLHEGLLAAARPGDLAGVGSTP
jgi:hypothetical protein